MSYPKALLTKLFKNTTLLYLGGVFFVLGIILVFVNGEQQIDNISGIDDLMGGSLLVFVLASIIVAPILEECAFRLPLLQNKWHVMVGLLALVGVVLNFTSTVLTISIVALYAFLLLSKLFYSSKIPHSLVVFCFMFVFTIMHYPNGEELIAAFLGGFVFFS
jgi:membrane protease YdiL (CAAX protease family)